MAHQDIHSQFHTPISVQASLELQQVQIILDQVQLNQRMKDEWSYIWGNRIYTSNRFYNLNFMQTPLPFQWIWKTKVSKKIKIFISLIFRDRINSRNLIKRKNFNVEGDDYNCVLCSSGIEEYTYHLIFHCLFSISCWSILNIHWDHILYFFDMIKRVREECPHDFFLEIFRVQTPFITSWKEFFSYS
jgi:hypothetical protein